MVWKNKLVSKSVHIRFTLDFLNIFNAVQMMHISKTKVFETCF